jgi:molybdenum cofactor biosynthesis enzyme MoaA
VDKLFACIDEILNQRIILNRLNITGGEPSIVPETVNRIIERLNASPDYQRIHLHLNTNGLLPKSQEMMRIARFDSISISMHHYDMSVLSEIYNCHIPSRAMDFEGIDIGKINLSCNLIRGYIDSPEEARKMLDKTIDIGIPRIGFVGLMPVNNYCREHFIDLEEIRIDSIPHVYFTKSKNRGRNCKCSNYLYNRDGKILEIYMRNYMNPNYCESSVVFDGQHLRQGFHDDNIIY